VADGSFRQIPELTAGDCLTRTPTARCREGGPVEGQPFSRKGKYYTIAPEVPYRGHTLKEITLLPAPEHQPVECWQPIQLGSGRLISWRNTASAA
jgi:hypothetical protein